MNGDRAEFDNNSKILTVSKNEKDQNLLDYFFDLFKNNNKQNVYTPCKDIKKSDLKIIDSCPDWSFTTNKTINDKKNKMVYHYGSFIKIKNIPVFYTPYFSHPDPTVKRKSGFLTPTIKNFKNLGQTLKVPYFHEINNNEDITFAPIYYFDENPIYLFEYRKQFENGKLIIDSSYTDGYRNLTKNINGNIINRSEGSKNHFFINYLGKYKNLIFPDNEIEINIQKISEKNYLSVNEINTNYVKQDITSLNSNIIINSYENNKKLRIASNIYENLNINDNSKYQYTLPSIEYSDFLSKFDNYINFSSYFTNQNLGQDKQQLYLINKVETNSDIFTTNYLEGITGIFKTSINNINFYNQNITNSKDNLNNHLYLTAALQNEYPLIKYSKDNLLEETIVPKIITKLIVGSNTNSSDQNNIQYYDSIYSLNRANDNINPETGASIGYGLEYNSNLKNKKKQTYSKKEFSIGQVYKPPGLSSNLKQSAVSETNSNIVGNINFNYNFDLENDENALNSENLNIFDLKYQYILSNNFNDLLKNSINSKLSYNKNTFSTNYYKNKQITNEHWVEMKYEKNLENNFNIALGGRKNIKNSFTENNFFEINYESDCMKIILNLSKKFYQNEEIKPSNNLTLSLTLKPFGSPIAPDLSSFLN